MKAKEGWVKAVAICGSSRAGGNTEQLLKHALDRLAKRGIEGRLVLLQWKIIHPCLHCGDCSVMCNGRCVIEGDDFPDVFKDLRQADVILIGAPVDSGAAVASLKALLERAGRVASENGNLFSRKLGAPIAVVGREVSQHTLQRLLTWFPAQGITVPGSPAYPKGKGISPLALQCDRGGEEAVEGLVDNLVWLAEKLAVPETTPPAGHVTDDGKARR